MITLVTGILAAILSSYTLYLLLLTVAASRVKVQKIDNKLPRKRLAVLIPAHNEEQVIARTLRSVLQARYPHALLDCWVIADNCSDHTAEIARAEGAQVLERYDNINKGKGYALEYGFEKLLMQKPKYEGFMILDADTVIDLNALEVASTYLEYGHQVIQLSDMVEQQESSWSNESIRTGFILYNYVRPLGRKYFGLSAGLRGNGMIFSRDVITSHPWRSYSLAEDLEYGLNLLLEDESVVFAPEATVWARMTQSSENAESQRRRWEIGRFPVMKKYIPLLLQAAVKKRRWKFADACLDLTMPPLVNLILMLAIMALVTFLASMLSSGSWVPFAISVAGITAGFAHLFLGLSVYPDKGVTAGYLLKGLPRYALWKAMLYLKIMTVGSEKSWVRTTREK